MKQQLVWRYARGDMEFPAIHPSLPRFCHVILQCRCRVIIRHCSHRCHAIDTPLPMSSLHHYHATGTLRFPPTRHIERWLLETVLWLTWIGYEWPRSRHRRHPTTRTTCCQTTLGTQRTPPPRNPARSPGRSGGGQELVIVLLWFTVFCCMVGGLVAAVQ